MRLQSFSQVPTKQAFISLHFYSEKEANDFIRKNGLDESHCKHYFKEGCKVTLTTNSFVDMYNLYHQVKDFIVKMLGTDYYQLDTMVGV